MPSYADLMAPGLAPPQSGGPVRIFVSGKWTWDELQGSWTYDETDEREEAMEVDELLVDESEETVQGHGQAWSTSEDTEASRGQKIASRGATATLGARLFADAESQRRGQSIVVLDTNVLISSLGFFDALFDLLLQLRLSALSTRLQTGAPRPSPMVIVIPYVVLVELDGLKKRASASSSTSNKGQFPTAPASQQRELAEKAQEATRWILGALQRQKRSYVRFSRPRIGDREEMLDPEASSQAEIERPLEEKEWVLHVERREEARARKGNVWDMTPDEEILSLCSSLMAASASDARGPQDAFLVSDDVNARARAEAEGIRTLDLATILGTERGSRSASAPALDEASIARQLLEQWNVQLGIEPLIQGATAHERQPGDLRHLGSPAGALPTMATSETVEEEPMSLDDEYGAGEASTAHAVSLPAPRSSIPESRGLVTMRAPSAPVPAPAPVGIGINPNSVSGAAASIWAKAVSSPTRSRKRPTTTTTLAGASSTTTMTPDHVRVASGASVPTALNPLIDVDVSDLPAAYPTRSRYVKRKAQAWNDPDGKEGRGAIGRGSDSSMWSRGGEGATSKKRW